MSDKIPINLKNEQPILKAAENSIKVTLGKEVQRINAYINDIEVSGRKNGHDYNLANLEDLTAKNISTDYGKNVQEVMETKVTIGSFINLNLAPSFIVTKGKKVRMTGAQGGCANFNGVIYKAFEPSPMFQYYTMNMTTGEQTPFIFPELSAFDIYDGEYIIRQSSDVVDISTVGNYEEYTIEGLTTNLVCVRSTFEDLGIADYEESDGTSSNVWLSFISGSYTSVSFDKLAIQTSMGVSTLDNYVYILLPASMYNSYTGTVTEKVQSTLTMNSMNKLIYCKKDVESIYHGETILELGDNTSVTFLTFPNMMSADFCYISEHFKQITKVNTSNNNSTQIFKVDDTGNVQISVAEFKKSTFATCPVFAWEESENASLASNQLFYALTQDNVLFVKGYIKMNTIKAQSMLYGFRIAQLPSAVTSILKSPVTGFYGAREYHNLKNAGSYIDPYAKKVTITSYGAIFFQAEEEYEDFHDESNLAATLFNISLAVKLS